MKYIHADNWQPKGIETLEDNAWAALKHPGSTSVIAGPGAGKTEFLAQRAAYLLETGICPANQQILAISFKTDAAKNLAARVKARCPPELSRRFMSMTFDAFTKSLVDRFRLVIHADWRPTKPYDIIFPYGRDVSAFWRKLANRVPDGNSINHVTRRMNNNKFESEIVGRWKIPVGGCIAPQSTEDLIVMTWLSDQIKKLDGEKSCLSFTTINRLAELIIRSSDQVRRALKATYPFVFIDEFQDTTYSQYDFLLTVFGSGNTTVTAVGDFKQRIMAWAGARTDVFHRFEGDFAAKQFPLLSNYRSTPELVAIQQVVAQAIDHGTNTAIAR